MISRYAFMIIISLMVAFMWRIMVIIENDVEEAKKDIHKMIEMQREIKDGLDRLQGKVPKGGG
jgi:hypothetical protein